MALDPKAVARMAAAYTAAWNSKSAAAVAGHFTANGEIVINGGTPWRGTAGLVAMAAGFYADVPDLTLVCDDFRVSGNHVLFAWTFTGHDAGNGAPLTVRGWEEWDLTDELKVSASRGWFDAEDYARQVAGG